MELNREQIVKALECCGRSGITPSGVKCDKCPYQNNCNFGRNLLLDALALSRQYEQKIFEFENRLKECENGYEGTLALERAKVKELTEENERLRAGASECVAKIYRFMLRYVDKLSEIDEIDITVRIGQIIKEMLGESHNEGDN